MQLRKFRVEDLESVLQLFHETVHSVGVKYYSDEQVEAWSPKEGIDKQRWLDSLLGNFSYVIGRKRRANWLWGYDSRRLCRSTLCS